ncbi:alpha/beta fold hydrolase, partial [Salegentibacter sp.]|uniref:alpha/beta fold hydrolase n=1 Tax=Salegentibacter sp. TaxID=1903072 RepID=UPI0035682FD0
GRSSSPANKDFSLERQLKDYEEIREQLGYDSWLTLGHSFGGILQTAYAKAYPKATRGMLMINTTLYLNDSFCNSWSPKAAEFLGETIPDCASDTISLRERMDIHINKLREKDLFWKMAFAEKKNDSVMNATYAGFENWNHEYSATAMNDQEHWKDFRKLATAINVPVLFFYGTKDWMVGPAHYKGIDFPKMLLWKANSGHLPFLEARSELEEAITAYREKFGV